MNIERHTIIKDEVRSCDVNDMYHGMVVDYWPLRGEEDNITTHIPAFTYQVKWNRLIGLHISYDYNHRGRIDDIQYHL